MILRPSVGESHREHPELAKATTTDGMDVRSRLIAQLSGRAAPTRQVRIGSFSRFAPLPMDDASGADGICNDPATITGTKPAAARLGLRPRGITLKLDKRFRFIAAKSASYGRRQLVS